MRNIATNTILTIAARVVNLAVALILVGLLTRYLGPNGYGAYATILAYLAIFVPLADLGLYSYLLREIGTNLRPAARSRLIRDVFSIRLAALVVILPLSLVVTLLLPYSLEIRLGIAIAALSSLFLSLSQVVMPVFQKRLAMGRVALAELTGRAVQLGLFIAFIGLGLPLLAFIFGLTVAAAATFFIEFFLARPFVRLGWHFPWRRWRIIVKDSLPIGLGLIFILIYFKIDAVMLSVMQSQAAVGIYNLGYKVLESVIFFPAAFMGLVTPMLARALNQNKVRFRALLRVSFNIIAALAVPVMMGLIFTAPQIIRLLGGEAFLAASTVLVILAPAIFLIFFGHLYSAGVITLNKQRQSVYVYLGGALLNFGLNLYAIPRYSYLGAAWTTVITETIITLALAVIVIRASAAWPNIDTLMKALAAGILMSAFLISFPQLPLLALLAGGGVFYGAGFLLLKGLKRRELAFLFNKPADNQAP